MQNINNKLADIAKRFAKIDESTPVTSYTELRKQHAKEANQDIQKLQQETKQKRIESIHGHADLNPQWRFDTMVNDADDIDKALEFAQTYLNAYEDPRFREQQAHMFIFYGDYGRGKSHLAGAIAHHLIEHFETSVLYRQLSTLLEMRFYSFDYDAKDSVGEEFRQMQRDLVEVDLLILDEVGVNETLYKKPAQAWLGNLLRQRQAAHKNCIIITNHDLPGLANALGTYCSESIRQYDTYKIHFSGPSRREEFLDESVSSTPIKSTFVPGQL